MTYSYKVTDIYHKIKIELANGITGTKPKLKVYKNGSSTAVQTINSPTGTTTTTYYYLVDLSNGSYNVGDELTFRLERGSSTSTPYNTNEGVTILVNGELEVDDYHSNTYTVTPTELGDTTIQFVYKGNNATNMSYTDPIVLHTKQEDDSGSSTPSGEYTLEFVKDYPSNLKYDDGTVFKLVLKQGGVPIEGRDIYWTTPKGTVKKTTNKNGRVGIENNLWNVGKYTIGGTFEIPNTSVYIRKFEDIKIEKGDANIKSSLTGLVPTGSKVAFAVESASGKNVTGENVEVTVNGSKVTKKLNDNGHIWFKPTKIGVYEFKISYKGNKNLNPANKTFNIIMGSEL